MIHMPDTALLLMDFQAAIVERFAGVAEPLLSAVDRAAAAARANGILVVYVRVAFRPGAPEVDRNRSMSQWPPDQGASSSTRNG